MNKATKYLFLTALALGAVITAPNAHAVFLRGQPYTPTGANFSIFAVQGITPSSPTGVSGVNPQVNGDFEFANSIGVSYDKGNGQLQDFGLGLYQDAAHNTLSTGLRINYNAPVDAFSVKVTLEDFDIKPGDTFFNPRKVEPGVVIFGANGQVLANADPTKVFSALTYNSSVSNTNRADVWDLDFAKLFNNLNLADTNISGFLLYADMLNGEKANSDPYLLVSVGNGIPSIPEASNYVVGAVALSILGFSHLRFRRQTQRIS
jgi:hypothetical protein